MHDLIRRWLAWARAVFRTNNSRAGGDRTCPACAGLVAPKSETPPVGDASYWVWITAHGIDLRPRVPHHDTEAVR
ncbi:hypothetical protein [Streptomyces abikoensis]|uniref:hypothetical protein n=1 Tax=Streptomyces abikoensis TaxID=97398 RepID=UPI0016734987|nr:hypothetical protein [Streptomyces abikoensis]GGP66688.1 hypothetical protein GCM10010214_46150 [Streptomyces abikoensis]